MTLYDPYRQFQGYAIRWCWISHKRYDIQFQWNTNRDLHTPCSTMSFRMILSDLEWLSKIFNDTKRRTVSAPAELVTRGPIHAKFCMRAYSGSECVFSPFGGWRPPAGGKRGKWNFRYYGSEWGIFAFWRFLSDISAMRGWIHIKFYFCVGTMSADVPPSPVGSVGPWRREEGELKTQKIGRVVSFVHRAATISIFLSVAKCGPICKAQTCAHSGVEPSRSAKTFLQCGPKSSKKFRIFHHFDTLRPYISETIKNRGI